LSRQEKLERFVEETTDKIDNLNGINPKGQNNMINGIFKLDDDFEKKYEKTKYPIDC